MDKEERAKYDCVKDKENLEKFQKTGRSFLYMTQKGIKETWSVIAIMSVYMLILVIGLNAVIQSDDDKVTKQKQMLVIQVDNYIKHDFKNMNCFEKNNFMEKYSNDPSIYGHQEMKDWLQSNFDDNCSSLSK